MIKNAIFVVVFCALLNDLIPATQAHYHRDNERKIDVGSNVKDETSSPKYEFTSDDHEKYYKKKYYKEDKYDKEYAYRKYNGHGKKRFVNSNEFEESPKNGKYNKYEKRQNHYENPYKNKEVNYHDKIQSEEKERYHAEQEIIEEPTLISLHHDIDVNFIGHHDALTSDAEIINVEDHKGVSKKMEYLKSANGVNENKIKTNFYKSLREIDLTSIPPANQSALVARYVLHNVDWTAMATISANSKMRGNPFVNIISVSDGPVNKGSGVPFFYMTPRDISSIDLDVDNRCTITVTLAETGFCKAKKLDPESPLCARLILNGKIKKVKPNTEEEKFAKEALFSRHPDMKNWPTDHGWYFAKLKIKQIILLNHFGGATYISIQDYFDANNA